MKRCGGVVVPDLQATTDLCKLMGDSTRVRLLALVSHEELTVAELVRVTRLPQPRVSTHLGRLREAGLLLDRRVGSSVFYALAELSPESRALWEAIRASTRDPLLEQDRRRLDDVLRGRAGGTWADSVAGQMARHWFPGRTWEALARTTVGLLRLGRVLDVASGDGAVAELIAPRADAVVCLDVSERVVDAGRRRLAHLPNVRFELGDMHELAFPEAAFDQVALMHALVYSHDPARVLEEAARVLRPGGSLVGSTLVRHPHAAAVERFGHVQLGFEVDDLRALIEAAGLRVALCQRTSRERRPPHFESLTFYASLPGSDGVSAARQAGRRIP